MFSRKQMDQNIHFVLSASFNPQNSHKKQPRCTFCNPNLEVCDALFVE